MSLNRCVAIQVLHQLSGWSLQRLIALFYESERSDSPTLKLPSTDIEVPFIIVDIRQELLANFTFHRIFISTKECSEYERKVGWVLDEDISKCMICQTAFTAFLGFSSKHHCRACGSIVCGDCSSSTAVVVDINPTEELRVCDLCNWGQVPVYCLDSHRMGKSVLIEEDHIAEDDRLKSSIQTARSTVLSAPRAFDPVLQKQKNKHRRYLQELNSLLPYILLKQYGNLEMSPVTTKFVMRAVYFLPKEEESFIQQRFAKKMKPFILPSEVIGDDLSVSSALPDVCDFIYVNVCGSNKIPSLSSSELSTISKTDKSHDYTIFTKPNKPAVSVPLPFILPMVFNTVVKKHLSNRIVDVAINDSLLEQMETQSELREELMRQILLGISIFFPEHEFSHGERFLDYPHNTPITPAAYYSAEPASSTPPTDSQNNLLHLLIPASHAVSKLRIVFTSMTDLVLSAKHAQKQSRTDTSMEEKKERFIQLLPNVYSLQNELSNKQPRAVLPRKSLVRINLMKEGSEIDEKENKENFFPETLSELSEERSGVMPPSFGTSRLSIAPKSKGQSESLEDLIDLMFETGSTASSHYSSAFSMTSRSSKAPLPAISTAEPKRMKKQKSLPSPTWTYISQSLKRKQSGLRLPKLEASASPSTLIHKLTNQNEGQRLLTPDSVKVVKADSIDSFASDRLKLQTKKNPQVIVGWQVIVVNLDQTIKGLYVITGVTSTMVNGKLYRISALDEDDQWIKLKMSSTGKGFPFQLFRKVLTI